MTETDELIEQARLDEICKECGLCEYDNLARKRDEARIMLEWIFRMCEELVKNRVKQ